MFGSGQLMRLGLGPEGLVGRLDAKYTVVKEMTSSIWFQCTTDVDEIVTAIPSSLWR
jgi:hypothetical protein